jgi:short subunit dehydrogenase-like uncharacterized protein
MEMMPRKKIAVYGAYGHTARFVLAELRRRGFHLVLSGRNETALRAVALAGDEVRVATVDDSEALDRAFGGVDAVVNCGGPFLDTAAPVFDAALRSRLHALDIAAEQPPVRMAFERFDDVARAAHVVVLPGMAFYGGLGDLLATAAMADWQEADAIVLATALDSWQPTRGTRVTGERNVGPRSTVIDGRLEPLASPAPRRDWSFPPPFGEQRVQPIGLGDVILLHRHLRAPAIDVYLNEAPLADLHDPNTPPPAAADASGRSAQTFLVEARATRGAEVRRVVARGRDIYAFTAPLVGEALERLLSGRYRDTGVLAPGEAFDARDFLRALEPAGLQVEGL